MRRVPKGNGSLLCPTDPEHGELVRFQRRDESGVLVEGPLRCIHQDHDGRPAAHPDGPAPSTRATFTLDEAEAARDALLGITRTPEREAETPSAPPASSYAVEQPVRTVAYGFGVPHKLVGERAVVVGTGTRRVRIRLTSGEPGRELNAHPTEIRPEVTA